jgi:hypothetical protein
MRISFPPAFARHRAGFGSSVDHPAFASPRQAHAKRRGDRWAVVGRGKGDRV